MLHLKNTKIIAVALLFAICCITIFWQLGARPILIYDEGRQAVNAIEMANNGNPFVTTYEGRPDMWNTKPPFFIWVTTLSIKAFGPGLWALRLPSALAALALVFSVFAFVRKHSNLLAGFLCALVLATSPGFIGEHAARTADFDATLTLFVFLYCAAFYNFITTQKARYIWLCALFFTLAFLTKSMAACFALPALMVFTLIQKKLPLLLRNWQWYAAFSLSALGIAGYYLLREQYNPGFIATAINNEIGQRYLSPAENHSGPWYFYFTFLADWRRYSLYFILLLPLGLMAFLYRPAKHKFSQMALLVVVAIFIVISSSATKLSHYDTPLYPFLAIIVGMGLYGCYHFAQSKHRYLAELVFIPPAIMLGFCIKYVTIKTHQADTNTDTIGTLLQSLATTQPAYKTFTAYSNIYNAPLTYYTIAYAKKGYTLKTEWAPLNDISPLHPGDTIIVFEPERLQSITATFNYQTIAQTPHASAIIISSSK